METCENSCTADYLNKWRPQLRKFLKTQRAPYIRSGTVIDAWKVFCPGFYPNSPRKAQIQTLGRLLSLELPVYSSNSRGGKVYKNKYSEP
jgi:hypothetical protein